MEVTTQEAKRPSGGMREPEARPEPNPDLLAEVPLPDGVQVTALAWAPRRPLLAVATSEYDILLFDISTARANDGLTSISDSVAWFTDHTQSVYDLAWSPDGRRLAAACADGSVTIRDIEGDEPPTRWSGEPESGLLSLCWLNDSELVYAGFNGITGPNTLVWRSGRVGKRSLGSGTDELLDRMMVDPVWRIRRIDDEHLGVVAGATTMIVSTSDLKPVKIRALDRVGGGPTMPRDLIVGPDGTRLYVAQPGSHSVDVLSTPDLELVGRVTGFDSPCIGIGLTPDGAYLLVKLGSGEVRIWSTEELQPVAALEGSECHAILASPCAHAGGDLIASTGRSTGTVLIWSLGKTLEQAEEPPTAKRYRTAKVVLVGDSGVGKSGLARVLGGEEFAPTESSHGCSAQSLSVDEIVTGGVPEQREILLWDLGGQPGYRVVHQLHLADVSAAVLVCDARDDVEPLAGVRYWARALSQAMRQAGREPDSIPLILTTARCDRGRPACSREEIEGLREELGIRAYMETSAKTGVGVEALRRSIERSIDWEDTPPVTSSRDFDALREFLAEERASGRPLWFATDLHRDFMRSPHSDETEPLSPGAFRSWLTNAGQLGLLRPFEFGDLVLIHPELMDSYASELVIAARREPHALGEIALRDAVRIPIPRSGDPPLSSPDAGLIARAVIHDLIRLDCVVVDRREGGTRLIFPAQTTRRPPDEAELPRGRRVRFEFEGAPASVYTILCVRLLNSDLFELSDLWRNTIAFRSTTGLGGMQLCTDGEGQAVLELFMSTLSPREQALLLRWTDRTLDRLGVRFREERSPYCAPCGRHASAADVDHNLARGLTQVFCAGCGAALPVEQSETEGVSTQSMDQLDISSDSTRDKEAGLSIVDGKEEQGQLDAVSIHLPAALDELGFFIDMCSSGGLRVLRLDASNPLGEARSLLNDAGSLIVFLAREQRADWERRDLRAVVSEFEQTGRPIIALKWAGDGALPDWLGTIDALQVLDVRKPVGPASIIEQLRRIVNGEPLEPNRPPALRRAPIEWNLPVVQELRDLLMDAIPETNDARLVAAEAGLPRSEQPNDIDDPLDLWSELMERAADKGVLHIIPPRLLARSDLAAHHPRLQRLLAEASEPMPPIPAKA